MLLSASDNAVAGHMRPPDLQLDHTGLGYSLWHFLKIFHWKLKKCHDMCQEQEVFVAIA